MQPLLAGMITVLGSAMTLVWSVLRHDSLPKTFQKINQAKVRYPCNIVVGGGEDTKRPPNWKR